MRDFLLRFVLVFSEKIELFEHDEWFKQWVKDIRNGRLRKLLDDFLASYFQLIQQFQMNRYILQGFLKWLFWYILNLYGKLHPLV